jgi:hypothetical protein
MTTTTDFLLRASDGWVQVSDGSPSVTIQLKTDGPVHLKVQTLIPDAGTLGGIILSDDGDTAFTGNALAATDKVFLLCRKGDDDLTVIKT